MKEIVFLQIGEKRNNASFLRKVGRLIHIPITEKATNKNVYEALAFSINPEEQEAWERYNKLITNKGYQENQYFMEAQFFTPEPGIALYAIFEVRWNPSADLSTSHGDVLVNDSALEAAILKVIDQSRDTAPMILADALRNMTTFNDPMLSLAMAVSRWKS